MTDKKGNNKAAGDRKKEEEFHSYVLALEELHQNTASGAIRLLHAEEIAGQILYRAIEAGAFSGEKHICMRAMIDRAFAKGNTSVAFCNAVWALRGERPWKSNFSAKIALERIKFLAEVLSKEAPSQPAETTGKGKGEQETPLQLTDTESNILEALGDKTMTGPELLKKAGYENSSHYRGILSNLVKRGILEKTGNGYKRAKAV